jgi:hypothetical protein
MNKILKTLCFLWAMAHTCLVSAQPTPEGYIDIILVCKTNAEANQLRNQLQANELDYSTPSQARLWRIRKGTVYVNNGVSITINSATDIIGSVSGRPESAGISDNAAVAFPYYEISTVAGNHTQPPVTTCPTVCMLPTQTRIRAKRDHLRVYVFDTGIELDARGFVRSELLRPYVDLTHAWNFVDNNRRPNDDHGRGHGTIVSSIAIQYVKRLIYYGWNTSKVVPIKVLDKDGKGWTFDLIKAFDKATREGADIINCSLVEKGTIFPSAPTPLQIAIEMAKKRKILLVSGAGNDTKNIDITPYFPASLPNTNQITVASSNCANKKSWFTNFGALHADVFAVGSLVTGLGKSDSIATVSGTSFAAPIVSGFAAILSSQLYQKDDVFVKNAILASVDLKPDFNQFCVSGGVVNVCKGTAQLPSLPPLEKEVPEAAESLDLNVFPNPITTDGLIQFTVQQPNAVTIKIMNLLNVDMQLVTNQHYEVGTYSLPLQTQHLPAGFYYLVVQNNGIHEMRKIEVIK